MQTRIAKRIITLTLMATTMGCDQASFPFGTGTNAATVSQVAPSSNPRNQLLARLQGKDNASKLETLLEIIQHDNNRVIRRDAISYVAGLGAEAKPLEEPLTQLVLKLNDPHVVDDLQRALVDIEANVEPFLLSAVGNTTDDQLTLIIETLGKTRASSPETLKLLQQQLFATNSILLDATCQALEHIGPAAASTLPMLISVAERPRVPLAGTNDNGRAFRESRDTTDAAIRAILAIGANESAVPVLINCLAMEPRIAAVAAEALTDVGPAAASAFQALNELTNRDDHGGHDIKTRLAREAASKAIIAITPVNN